ncbi:MAG: Rad52/Rad22 family DNA repair protein [Acidobacteriota bacterium]
MKRNYLKEAGGTTLDPLETSEDRGNVLEFSATLRELKKHVDPHLVKQREGWRDQNGNVQMVDYVEWHTVADILDDAAPNWAHTVKDIRQIGDLMTVTVAITIDGVTREGIGTGPSRSETGIKKAEHDALKRAAVKFGIARELYKKEFDAIEREGATSSNDDGYDFPSDPVARSLGELVTAKQLGMIRAIARELNVDPDEECNSAMNCSTDELTKRAASSLIQHLQDRQLNNDSAIKPPLRRVG